MSPEQNSGEINISEDRGLQETWEGTDGEMGMEWGVDIGSPESRIFQKGVVNNVQCSRGQAGIKPMRRPPTFGHIVVGNL